MRPILLAQVGPDATTLSGNPLWVDALLVGGILLVIASALMLLRNRKRQAGQAMSGRDHLDHLRDSTRERDRQRKDLEGVALSIEEMARRVGAQLDNKATRVEALLDEAERTIRRLEAAQTRATRTADQPPASVAAVEALAANVAAIASSSGSDLRPAPGGLGTDVALPASAARSADAFVAGAASPAAASAPAPSKPKPPPAPNAGVRELSSRVRLLSSSGLAPAEIAAEVGEHIGKVELILALARE